MEKEQIEDLFIEWQAELAPEIQEKVAYDHFDPKVKTVFLKRENEFDRTLTKVLEEKLQEVSDKDIRVNTIHNPRKSSV